jgi:hypothetical protein
MAFSLLGATPVSEQKKHNGLKLNSLTAHDAMMCSGNLKKKNTICILFHILKFFCFKYKQINILVKSNEPMQTNLILNAGVNNPS